MHRVPLLKKTKHLLHCALLLSYTMVCCQNLLDIMLKFTWPVLLRHSTQQCPRGIMKQS